MNQPSLTQDFVTTKDAAAQSGYTTDYLSRLVRTNKVIGHRLGRNWLIDRESFARFLEQHTRQKTRRAQTLARVRTQEYRTQQPHAQAVTRTAERSFVATQLRGEPPYSTHPWRSRALALSVACAVVILSASAASSGSFVQLAVLMGTISQDAATGFSSTFGSTFAQDVARIDVMRATYVQEDARVHEAVASATSAAAQGLAAANVFGATHTQSAAIGTGLFLRSTVEVMAPQPNDAHRFVRPNAAQSALPVTLSALVYGYEHPRAVAVAAGQAYVSVGETGYHLIIGSFDAYQSLILRAGDGTYTLATGSLDAFRFLPPMITRMNLALGNAVIDATHRAIGAEVGVAYGLAWAAPASAQVSVAFVGTLGNSLASAAVAAPKRTVAAFLALTGVPAQLAPTLSAAAWGAEYGVAARFVAEVYEVQDRYLALVDGGGAFTYQGMTVVYAAPSAIGSFPGVSQLASAFAHRFP